MERLGQPSVVHSFADSLERSYAWSEQLDEVYWRCFPHLAQIEAVTDVELQKQGVDKILTLTNGKQIYIDEKARDVDYGDFLLEEYSVEESKTVGWLGRDKLTDYVVYVVKPARRAYFLPFLLLQRAWCRYYGEWAKQYRVPSADNGAYHTSNLAIPKRVLFDGLLEAETL